MNQTIRPKAPGVLDPLFGGGEVSAPDQAQAVLALSNKLLLIAMGVSGSLPFRVARLTANGTPDHSFGGGVVDPPLPAGVAPIPRQMVELSNGKYLIACSQRGFSANVHLIQLLPDGTPDRSFGTAGVATFEIVDAGESRSPSAVSSVGSPCVAVSESTATIYLGSSFSSDKDINAIVFGINLDGSLKSSFNGGFVLIKEAGKRVRVDALSAVGHGVLIAGAMMIAPDNDGDALVASYDQSGRADLSFGVGGKVVIPGNDGRLLSLTSMAVDSNGSILASGYFVQNGDAGGLLIVLNASGSFNLVFNRGVPLYSAFAKPLYFFACAWQEDGQLIVTGLGDDGCLLIARYNADGSLDLTFGNNGWAIYSNKPNSRYEDSTLTIDGKVVILGAQAVYPYAVRYLLN
ncbi:MAG: hypothetical protein ABWY17_07820 [Pseudomonas sp.]